MFFALRFVLRRTSAPSHAAPLFLPWIHRSRAHLVSDGSAPLARFPSVAAIPLPSGRGAWDGVNADLGRGVKKWRG